MLDNFQGFKNLKLEKENYDEKCPICQGAGVITKNIGGTQYAFSCDCRIKEVLKRKLIHANIPEEYWGKEDEKISERVKAIAIMGDSRKKIDINKFANKYINGFDDFLEKRRNIVIMGTNGAGKTFLSTKIGINAIKNGIKTQYITSKGLIKLCGNTWNNEESAKRFKKLQEVDLLILDEYGKEYRTDNSWTYTELEDFLNYRFYQDKVTIIVTNFYDLYENEEESGRQIEVHQQSILSRLKNMAFNIRVGIKEDYRKEKLEKMWSDLDMEVL
jgi:DNA replication protein DnaC